MIRRRLLLPRRIFRFCLLVELLLTMVLGAPLFVFLSPPGPVGREIRRAVFFHTPAWEGVLVVGASVYCWNCGEFGESCRAGALRLVYGLPRERSWRERITGPTVEKDSRT